MKAVALDGLMKEALRCGVTVLDFWSMTPRETADVIEAFNWQQEQRERQQMTMAWLTAALTRTKRLPKLAALRARQNKPRRLEGRELIERRREFSELATPERLARINRAMAKGILRKTSE